MSAASKKFVPQLTTVSIKCGECAHYKNENAELKREILRLRNELETSLVFADPEKSQVSVKNSVDEETKTF